MGFQFFIKTLRGLTTFLAKIPAPSLHQANLIVQNGTIDLLICTVLIGNLLCKIVHKLYFKGEKVNLLPLQYNF